MTREEVEYTLRKSGAEKSRLNWWWRHDKCPYQSFGLGRKYVRFLYPLYEEKVLYSELTPEKWIRSTGLKFYKEGK